MPKEFVFPATKKYRIDTEERAVASLAKAQGTPDEARVREVVKERYPTARLEKSEVEVTVPLWKDDAKQIVYGVVMTPGLRDSQKDIASAEEIEKSAHAFLVQYRKHDVQHQEEVAGVETVESFIAPQDMVIEGQKVLKGAWVMATHVSDPDVWERVRKGEITGYSIGGSAIRVPEAA